MALGCTVSELLSRIDSAELSEWMAYDSIDPIGNDRLDMHAGIVASTIANSVGGKINGKSFAPSDFMPFIDKPKPNPVAIFKAQMAHMVNRK